MKKIVIASLSAALVSPAFAVANFTGGGASGNTTSLTVSDCASLNATDTVRVNLSANNIGSYDCNATSVSMGVGIANTTGKNKVYSASSAGGGVTEASLSATPTTSDTQSSATTAAASS